MSMPLTEPTPLTVEDIRIALKDVYDPEVPVNIVDLGLVYRIELFDDASAPGLGPKQRVEIDVSMTSPGCPSHSSIMDTMRNRLAGIPGLTQSSVNLVWEPSWSPERLSADARKQLGID